MAENYWPFDAGAGASSTETRWRAMAQHWVPGGSGVLATELNKLNTFGDSTGLQVKVDTGRAWVRGHFYENDALKTVAIGSNSSGNPRIDRVVVRNDHTANTIGVVVIPGTPAASPTAPAITQTSTVWDVPLAQVAVANGAVTIAAGNVTDERGLVGPLGAALKVPSTAARTLNVPAPVDGMVVDNGGRLEVYDGAAWRRMVPRTSTGRTGVLLQRAAAQSIPTGTFTDITWDSETSDPDGFTAVPSTTITVPTGLDGLYLCTFTVVQGAAASNQQLRITAGGRIWFGPVNGSAGDSTLTLSFPIALAAGNTVVCALKHSAVGAINFTALLELYRFSA